MPGPSLAPPSPSSPRGSASRRVGARTPALAAIALVAFAVYARTLTHALVWDDLMLANLVSLRAQQGGAWAILRSGFQLDPQVSLGYYRPLVLLSLWLDQWLGGGAAAGYHFLNVLLHAVCSILVFALARSTGAREWAALLGALLFATHPVHTESVAFVSGRTDLLAALWALASAILWARVAGGRTRHPVRERVISVVAFTLAGLSKENTWVLPGVLLAWDALGIGGRDASREPWGRRNAPWLLGWSGALAVVMGLRWLAGVSMGAAAGTAPGWAERGLRLAAQLATYARLLVVPWPLQPYYLPEHVGLDASAAGALLLIGAVIAWGSRRAWGRAAAAALAWIGAFLVPALGVVSIPALLVAERFLYLPSAGLCWLVATALSAEAPEPRSRRWAAVVAGALSAAFALGSVVRAGAWRDEVTLFEDAVRSAPASVDAWTNLATAYGRAGRPRDAGPALDRALRLAPDSATAYVNLGASLGQIGRLADAERCLRKALALAPDNPAAMMNLAMVSLDQGRPLDAVSLLLRTVEVDPGASGAWDMLGTAYQQSGSFPDAIRAHIRSVALQPRSASAWSNLGHAYLGAGRVSDALGGFRRAVDLDDATAGAHYGLAVAYASVGDLPAARREADRVAKLDPALAESLARRLGDLQAGPAGMVP